MTDIHQHNPAFGLKKLVVFKIAGNKNIGS